MVARRPVSLALVLIGVFASSAVAQQNLPSAGETIDVSLVNVDVVVTDRNGQRVTGLTAGDFEIVENGRVQPLTNFAEYRSDALEESATAPASKRTILLFIERMALPPFHTEPLFNQLRKTVREVVRPGDSAAVVFWDYASAYTLQNFTDDIGKLESALTEIEMQSSGSPQTGDPLRARRFAREYLASLPPSNIARRQGLEDLWNLQEQSFYSFSRLKRKANELQALMRSMADEDGRKIVIFAATDFGLVALPERTGWKTFSARGEFGTQNARDAVARTANEHGITIYPVYPANMQLNAFVSSEEALPQPVASWRQGSNAAEYEHHVNQTRALDELARKTGGLTAAGSPDIVSLLPRIAEDLKTYYSLAYRTPATGTTKSRQISVHTKNREYRVRARREYVEKTDVTRMHDRVIGNLFRPENSGPISIHVEIDSIEKTGRNRWTVPVRVTIPVNGVSTGQSGKGAFSVYVATGGILGVMSDVHHQTQHFTTADFRPGQEHFTYVFPLVFEGATSLVSIGVLDEGSKDYGLKTIELPAFRTEARLGGE